MTRIRFEDLPSTNTPRNAENLNKLNNVVISSTEPTTGEEVWVQKGNSLYNSSNELGDISTSDGQNVASNSFTRTAGFINVEPNEIYTISTLTTCPQIVIFYYSNSSFLSFENQQNVSSITFTTPNNCNQVRFRYSGSSVWPTVLVQGSTAPSSYEEYIDKKIYTKNDNGVYELFYDESEINNTDKTIYANDFKCKNLFNKNYITAGYYVNAGNGNLVQNASNNVSNFIDVSGTNNIVISGGLDNDTYALYNASKTYVIGGNYTNGVAINTAGCTYIRFTVKSANLNTLQLEPGLATTNYTPHKAVGEEEYSTTEQVIGTWIDGKPIYRKIIELSSELTIGANDWASTGVAINNVKMIINSLGMKIGDANSQIRALAGSQNIIMVQNTSQFSISIKYIILEYTKTTD